MKATIGVLILAALAELGLVIAAPIAEGELLPIHPKPTEDYL